MKSPSSEPVVPASINLPEITPKAIVLAVVLSALLAGANAYLGLFAGMTVSASIPAAVLSMSILRFFRQTNILENNIVQTAASSGEALAAGVIFTIPALLLIGYWDSFNYWQTCVVSLVGGLLGVLFTIPLRRALIVDAALRFPEGVATAEVLKVGTQDKAVPSGAFRSLLTAALMGSLVKFGESGLRFWSDSVEGMIQIGRSMFYGGINLSPALIAVGFIIGLPIAFVVLLGGVLGWLVLLPIDQWLSEPASAGSGVQEAETIWSQHIRYVGIGAMLVGGLWTLVEVHGPVIQSLRQLILAYRRKHTSEQGAFTLRTDQDAKFPWVIGLTGVSLVLMVVVYHMVLNSVFTSVVLTAIMAVTAFLFSCVAAYMAGLVGSSSNPVSGVTIATIMITSVVLLVILGRENPVGPAATLLVAAVVCCAAAMGGDNLQDLKTGHLIGATPWKQQIMQVVGVMTAAVVIVPVLSLLQVKYGIGDVSIEHPHPLSAPQASLMAHLARGMFGGTLPWSFVCLGALIGAAIIVIDRYLLARNSSFRLPVLAIALGVYLPLKLSTAICAGGIISEWSHRRAPKKTSGRSTARHGGVLFAAGLVTGEAIMGIVLAIPVALTGFWPSIGANPFQIVDSPPWGDWPGVAGMIIVTVSLY
ncbi:MAG: OPT family oligopeptide transporter, partial [Nitrospiraceae bacterium]